jgi:hypothetical protein
MKSDQECNVAALRTLNYIEAGVADELAGRAIART